MKDIDVSEFLKEKEKMELEDAIRKAPYRISVGQALLDNDELNEKWSNFVTDSTNGFGHGLLLDETLQIMGMIKAGVPSKKIRETLSKIPNNRTIINYLSAFIHPEIVSEIDLYSNNMDREV